jgi:hypothetical protein
LIFIGQRSRSPGAIFRLEDTPRFALPLFIIGVELLSLQIKSNPKIKGALVNDTESLISQYADDTFLVLDGCELSLRETLICFENFNKASGLKIKTSKTRVVWV